MMDKIKRLEQAISKLEKTTVEDQRNAEMQYNMEKQEKLKQTLNNRMQQQEQISQRQHEKR